MTAHGLMCVTYLHSARNGRSSIQPQHRSVAGVDHKLQTAGRSGDGNPVAIGRVDAIRDMIDAAHRHVDDRAIGFSSHHW